MRGRIKFPFSSELLSNLYNGLHTSSYSWQSARRSLKRYQDRHIHMFSGAWCWVRFGQTRRWWQSLLGTILDCWFCWSIQHRNMGSILVTLYSDCLDSDSQKCRFGKKILTITAAVMTMWQRMDDLFIRAEREKNSKAQAPLNLHRASKRHWRPSLQQWQIEHWVQNFIGIYNM